MLANADQGLCSLCPQKVFINCKGIVREEFEKIQAEEARSLLIIANLRERITAPRKIIVSHALRQAERMHPGFGWHGFV